MGARTALGLRALTVIGVVNLAMVVSCILVGLSALPLGPVPQYPSYLTNGMCGVGTDIPC